MTCSRPRCPNLVHRNGLCAKHSRALPHGYRPAEPIRHHVARLRHRYDLATIVNLTGVTSTTIRNIERCRYANLKVGVWLPLLSLPVPARPVAGPGLLPAIGTARRIQALSVMGWSQTHIAEQLGVVVQVVNRMLLAPNVSSRYAAAIAELYDRLALTAGSSQLAASRAKAKGWVSSLAWDEDTVDDPDAEPDLGSRQPATFAERYTELVEHVGIRSEERIALILGIAPESVRDQCHRNRLARVS